MVTNKLYVQLAINGERLITDVQKDFANAYPYLKLEFFRNGSASQSRYAAHQKIASPYKLKDAGILKQENGYLEIRENMSVLQLVDAFWNQFGLSVQIFRKSGTLWLETTITEGWSLKQQNDHGREISGYNIANSSLRNFDAGRETERG